MNLNEWVKETKELCDKATAGKWSAGYSDGSGPEYIVSKDPIAKTNWGCSCCELELTEQKLKDAKFIAASRTDLPRALEVIEVLREALSLIGHPSFDFWLKSTTPALIEAYGFDCKRAKAALAKADEIVGET